MTTRHTPFASGTPSWVDLLSSDVEKSKNFYGSLFGWTATDAGPEFGNYVTFSSDGEAVAGMMGRQPGMPAPDGWSTYLATADIEASVAAIAAAGGQVAMAPMAVGELGSMALAADPAGAFFGLWQPGLHIGFSRYNEPGSVIWDEVHSRDFAASKAFYETVFGWTWEVTGDTDDFRYYQGQVEGATVAGLMDSSKFLPDGVPSHWQVYFNVESVDDSIKILLDHGGAVMRAAEDTPYGRIADVADSTGARFNLHEGPAVI